MNKKGFRQFRFRCLLIFLLLMPAAGSGQGGGGGGVFPLPAAEVASRIEAALTHRGFVVQRSPLAMGMTALKAQKGEETLRFILAPRSALATQVQASGKAGGRSAESHLRDFMGQGRRPVVKGRAGPAAPVPEESSNLTIPNAILARIESVVCVTAVLRERTVQFSGFAVDTAGLILCTAHDLTHIRAMNVAFYDGGRMEARIVKIDPRRDLVLLQVPARLDAFIPLTGGRNLVGMGERLYTVGCPENLNGTVYSGFVNGPPRRVRDLPLWQVNMEILPGSSGSPVFDVEGNLIGMVKGRLRGTDSVGFLIPVETIIAFLKENQGGR